MKAHTLETQKQITPKGAVELLKEGNARFVADIKADRVLTEQVVDTKEGQWPFATILSCIDSRASAELIFDQGIGDIFSVRVAGNFSNQDILGSMEFATKVAGSKVVVVLGHTKCGALKGALDAEAIDQTSMQNLKHLVHQFDNSLLQVMQDGEERSSKNTDLLNRLMHQNVKDTIETIRKESTTLRELEEQGEIDIVGAIYDVETGKVTFL